jgi:hypothetical protein
LIFKCKTKVAVLYVKRLTLPVRGVAMKQQDGER